MADLLGMIHAHTPMVRLERFEEWLALNADLLAQHGLTDDLERLRASAAAVRADLLANDGVAGVKSQLRMAGWRGEQEKAESAVELLEQRQRAAHARKAGGGCTHDWAAVERTVEQLLAAGRAPRALAALIAKRHNISVRAVRDWLKEHYWPKKEKRQP